MTWAFRIWGHLSGATNYYLGDNTCRLKWEGAGAVAVIPVVAISFNAVIFSA